MRQAHARLGTGGADRRGVAGRRGRLGGKLRRGCKGRLQCGGEEGEGEERREKGGGTYIGKIIFSQAI